MIETLPYRTADVPGLGGRIKARPEDFVVEELPLYEPADEGTHTFFALEKCGVATMPAIREIARALGVPHRHFGYAGLKDADALTTQTVSIEHVPPERLLALDLPRIRIRWARHHRNKLKLGHLRGNRFRIRLRDAAPGRLADARALLDRLAREGVPNYFGEQRFGVRGDTWVLGRALLCQDWDELIRNMLGRPTERDHGGVLEARRRFEQGDYEAAARAWPYTFRDERKACQTLARTDGDTKRAAYGIDKPLKRLYISAYQSYLFNRVVAERVDTLDTLLSGDLAYRHAGGAVFRVEDPAVEQPRADAFEISPSGPLFGYRMTEPEGRAAEIEASVLQAEGLAPGDFRAAGAHKVKGARRPLRIRPQDAAVESGEDELGPYYEFRFGLEPGAYATMVLRELCEPCTPAREDAS
jgi:tRNA pseudouridine13 synthase